MNRIGKTDDGGIIVAFKRDEVEAIEQGLELLNKIVAEPAVDGPQVGGLGHGIGGRVQAALERVDAARKAKTARLVRRVKIGTAAEPSRKGAVKVKLEPGATHRTCSVCGVKKPLSDYYEKSGKCKPCYNEQQKRTKAARAALEGMDKAKGGDRRKPAALLSRTAAQVQGARALRSAPRERDPVLDPPSDHGRTMRVGMQD